MAFLAGAARANITPPVGHRMSGYGNRTHGSVGIHDDLRSKALYLNDGTTRAAIVANDLLYLGAPAVAEIRRRVAAAAEIPAGNVFVCCTHTHAGPDTAYGDPAEDPMRAAYMETLFYKIAGAVAEARRNAVPARMARSRAPVQCGINRRERTPDRGVILGRNPLGPVCRDVDVLRFDDAASGAPLAVLFSHAVHGTTLGGDNYLTTSELSGRAERFVEEAFPGTVAMFCNGCAGDINPDPRGTFEWIDLLGKRLGAAAAGAATQVGEAVEPAIVCHTGTVLLPIEEIPSREACRKEVEEAEAAVRALEGQPPGRRWQPERRLRLARQMSAASESGQVDPGLPVDIQAVGIGEAALVGLPGEVFVEIGMEIARRSPFPRTLAVAYANGAVGYIPTAREIPDGGYEIGVVRARHQGRVIRPEADEALIEGAVRVLTEAHRRLTGTTVS
jgi:neutral ceramidase